MLTIFCNCGGIVLRGIGCNQCRRWGGEFMVTYRDMTFCNSKGCSNEECHRYYTDDISRAAEGYGLPIAISDFSRDCKRYDGKEEERWSVI